MALSLVTPQLSAQSDSDHGIGLALKTSTNGYGADVVFNFYKKMNVRLGYESLKLHKNFDFDQESVTYNADMSYKAGGLSLLFDYYVANHVFFTAGASINSFHTVLAGKATSSYQFGDIEISQDQIGSFNVQVDPSAKISPYLGIGFGRTLGLKKKVGFAFELGGFYQGSPDITLASTGLIAPSSDPDQGHEARLEKQIDQYSIYPVLKFSLSYKIAGF